MQSAMSAISSRCELFHGCSHQDHHRIRERMQFRTYSRGTTILRAGHTDRALWVILSGQCTVVALTANEAKYELAQLGPANTFGELSFFAPAKHRVSVHSTTNVEVAQLLREDFETLAATNETLACRLACNVATILARRLHHMDELICRTVAESRSVRQSEWQKFCQLMHLSPTPSTL